MKKFIPLLLIIIVFTFLLTNCEKENFIIEESVSIIEESVSQSSEIKLSLISKDKVQQNANLMYELEVIKLKKSELKLKNDDDALYDFEIDLSKVSYIENGDWHSYTFPIKRNIQTDYSFENLLLSENKDGGYDGVIIKYESSEERIYPFTNDTDINSLSMSYTPIDVDYEDLFSKCGQVCVERWEWTIIDNGDEGELVGDPFQDPPTYGWVLVSRDCTGSSCGGNDGESDAPYTTDNGGNEGIEGGGGGGPGRTTTTSPTTGTLPGPTWIEDSLNIDLTTRQLDFLADHPNVYGKIRDFLDRNNHSQQAEDWVNSAINILSSREVNSNDLLDYKRAILNMTNHLKQWGNPEDEFLAVYIESIIPDFNSMTLGDVQDIYKLLRRQIQELTLKYAEAIIVPFAEAAYPFVIYALTEATLGAALPLLSRIPLSMVIRGVRLNKMVKQVGLLGARSTTSNSIRIVTTSNPVAKAESLFTTLTKNAISKTTQSNGSIVANMGNGNFITYRPITASASNFEATISLNFPNIWTSVRNIKFVQ